MSSGLTDRLRSVLGLNRYEASAYEALLRLGEARPQEVAREASVPAQRIYDVLRSLESMGLVAEKEGVFYVVNPQEALGQLAEREVSRALLRAGEIRSLARDLSAAKSVQPQPRLLRGLDEVLAAALELASSCSDRALFVAYKVFERLSQLRPALMKLAEELRSGADILVPPGYASRYRRDVDELSGHGIRIIESEAALLDMMVACDTVIIGLTHRGDVIALKVTDPDMALAIRERLEEVLRTKSGSA